MKESFSPRDHHGPRRAAHLQDRGGDRRHHQGCRAAAPRAVERHHARQAARGEPRHAAVSPPQAAPDALRRGQAAPRLCRAPAAAFFRGPGGAAQRRAARHAAHRLAREHRGDAPAAGAVALSRRLPEVRLELVTGTTGALVAQVLDGDLEAAFVAEPFTAEGLESLHAFTEELVLVTPRGFPRIRSAKAIGHTPILAFATGCSYRRRLEAWLGGSGIAPERVMEYGSYHRIIACAAAGSGVAVVPRSVKIGRAHV